MQQFLIENKPLALFDIDGVLVRPWIIQYFSKFLANLNRPLFDPEIVKKMKAQLTLYEQNSDYGQLARNWVASYAEGVYGQSVVEIELASDFFWNSYWDSYVYNYTIDMVKLASRHCTTVAITASPIEPVASLCKRLGIEYIEALQVVSSEGVFKDFVLENPNNKHTIVEKYINCIDDKNKQKSLGFGDTVSDYPLWAMVGSAFMFVDIESSENYQKGMNLFHQIKLDLPHLEILQRPITETAVQKIIKERMSLYS